MKVVSVCALLVLFAVSMTVAVPVEDAPGAAAMQDVDEMPNEPGNAGAANLGDSFKQCCECRCEEGGDIEKACHGRWREGWCEGICSEACSAKARKLNVPLGAYTADITQTMGNCPSACEEF